MNEKISPEVNHQTDEHEDFDPLAELARIVAGESEDADVDQQPTEFASQEETLFASDDMEADLMRELQQTQISEEETSGDLSTQVESINELDASLDTAVKELNVESESDMNGFIVPAAPLEPRAAAPVAPQIVEPEEQQVSDTADFQNDLIDALQLELDDGVSEKQEPTLTVVESNADEEVELETKAISESEAVEQAIDEISFEEEMALIIEGSDQPETEDEGSAEINTDEDLGAAFLSEFEARAGYTDANDNTELEAEVEAVAETAKPEVSVIAEPEAPVEAVSLEPENTPELELDFEQAFSAELGLDASMDEDTNSAELSSLAAIEEEIQPSYEDEINFDPGHSGEVTDVARHTSEEKTGGVKYAVAAICVALLAGAGVAVYGFIGDGKSLLSSEMPVIEAIKTAYKTKPEDPGGKVVDNQDNATYAEVEGVGNQDSSQKNLVSNTEEPAIIDQSTADSSKDADRLANTEQSESAGATQNAVVKPRVVQIQTVKPDGTIIAISPSSNAASKVEEQLKLASNQAIQVATGVKAVTTQVIEPLKSLDGAKTTNQIVVPTASPLEKPLVQPKKVEVTKVQTIAVPKKKPVIPAATTQVANVVQPATNTDNQPTLLPSVKPAATTQVVTNTTPASNWVVQVSSSPSQQEAQSAYSRLSRKYSVLQGRSTNIQSAQVNGRTYYRLRLNTSSKADAANLCSQLKASGGDCFVTR